ncbi:ABC transporter protein [Rutstroemia sp. NJR-2017a WRK4]|nr:ABC transporter protein [Rutstroemia sp. NJR-2017a WRK4]
MDRFPNEDPASRILISGSRKYVDIIKLMSAACAAVFLLYLPIRIRQLSGSRTKNGLNLKGCLKVALGILLFFLLFIDVIFIPAQRVDLLIAALLIAALLSSAAALGLSLLLVLEQRQSARASDVTVLYLAVETMCDVLLLTMPSGTSALSTVSYPVLARCAVHVLLLVLECCNIGYSIDISSDLQPLEESASLLGRLFYTWINPILLQGSRNILVTQDMPPLGRNMGPESTRTAIIQTWSTRARPETMKTLPLALLRCEKKAFVAAIMPRLFLIFFRYSQPVLIKESIRYVMTYPTDMESSRGYWLVVSAVGIYVGLALSTAVYQQCLNRLKLVTRSALVGLIHNKAMESPGIAYDDGEATTLMSTDADSLDGIAGMVHETWAQVIEVLIGIRLLAIEVGFVAKNLQPRQKAWNAATQSRIGATSSFISSMKVVKMIGLQHDLTNRVQKLRGAELLVASKLRWVMVYYNASGQQTTSANGITLDTETAFTTVAILSMVTHPANMVMTIVPRAVAALAGFERIQSFLLRPSLQDNRGTLPGRSLVSDVSFDPLTKPNLAVQIRKLRVGHKQIILDNVNIDVSLNSLTIISGPTGCGKSTLLRAILGEVVPVSGSISLSTKRIAYCAQRPWLPSGTIRDVIYGAKGVEGAVFQDLEGWYNTVTSACCLTHDFNSLSDGDQTQIGSRGLNLSGGQRQRVTLARALFARCDILLLDDTFSGLDGETERTVFDNLFGETGLLRRLKTTVLLVSNSSQYFESVDHVVVLGNHGVVDQGHWKDITVKSAAIAKFSSGNPSNTTAAVSASFDKLTAQVRAKDEAELDLARQSGDSALYGNPSSLSSLNWMVRLM